MRSLDKICSWGPLAGFFFLEPIFYLACDDEFQHPGEKKTKGPLLWWGKALHPTSFLNLQGKNQRDPRLGGGNLPNGDLCFPRGSSLRKAVRSFKRSRGKVALAAPPSNSCRLRSAEIWGWGEGVGKNTWIDQGEVKRS